jgi:uncharacterized membrane protein (DUF373 family)
MNKDLLISVAKNTILFVRRSIVVIFLSVLVLGIIGFTIKWSNLIFQPESLLADYHPIIEDIFSILVVYELLELFRTLSPNRLMGIVLLVLARKIVLSPDHSYILKEVLSFAILLIVRLLWQRFGEKKNNATIE